MNAAGLAETGGFNGWRVIFGCTVPLLLERCACKGLVGDGVGWVGLGWVGFGRINFQEPSFKSYGKVFETVSVNRILRESLRKFNSHSAQPFYLVFGNENSIESTKNWSRKKSIEKTNGINIIATNSFESS